MAKNRDEKPVVSETESGEEEDDEASSEEEGPYSKPEQIQFVKNPSSSTAAGTMSPQPQLASKPRMGELYSSSEEETGSESKPDSHIPDPKVRPLASTPMGDMQKSKNSARKPRSKQAESNMVTPTKKRHIEEKETEAKDTKKSKKKKFENSEKKSVDDSKKNLFQRLWSEDDEIVILKGMIDYAAKKKSDPVADLNAFHDFIRKNLQVDVTKTQLQDKIRRLKKKYENNKMKEKEGKERTFSKPHEQKAYELSKDIWCVTVAKENVRPKVVESPKANGSVVPVANKIFTVANDEDVKEVKSAVLVADRENKSRARRVICNGASVEEWMMMKGVEMFEREEGVEGEKEWKKLIMDELESYVKQVETKAAQLRFVFDKLSSADYQG